MEPESMVHALEQIHDLLKPFNQAQGKAGGHLIDIHPTGEPVAFIRLLEEREQLLGYLQEKDDYIEYRQADDAVKTVVEGGLFQIEKTREFDFHTYAESFDSLKTYLDESWSDAVVPEDVIANAHQLDEDHGKRTVFLHERTRINILKKI